MDPSMQHLTLSGGSQDQPASRGVSKNIKKLSRGKHNSAGLDFDIIGSVGSFAGIMKQKGTVFSIEKGDHKKEGSVSCQVELTGVKVRRGYLFRKGAKEENGMAIVFGDQAPLGEGGASEVKTKGKVSLEEGGASEVKTKGKVSLEEGGVSEVKTKGKVSFDGLGKYRFREEGSIDKDIKLNLHEEFHVQDGEAARIKSMVDKENKLSLKKGISGSGSLEKSPSGDAMLLDETVRDLEALSADGLKSNKLAKKNVSEGMRISRSGDEKEDQKYDGERDISKEFDIKGVSSKKVSSDLKEHEILLKSDHIKQEGVKENTISTERMNAVNEKTQSHKDLFSDGLKSERSVEKGGNETLVGKTDTSLWMTQADYSGVKGAWNGSGTNMNGDSAPLQFQDIMGQIEEGATNMVKNRSDRIVITLEPPNLGTLNMDVRVHNDMVRMVLIVDNHDVKQVLHTNLDQLKTALQGQGLNIDRFEVLVQERSYAGNPGFQPGGGALFEGGRGRRDSAKEDTSSGQMLPLGGSELNEPSLGIINLFA